MSKKESLRSPTPEPDPEPALKPKYKAKAGKAQAANQNKEATHNQDAPKAMTSKRGAHNDTKEGKIETKFGTKKQGLHWIIYSGCAHLDALAKFEEICTMHNHSECAMYNAKANTIKEENCLKELDMEIQALNLKHLQHLSQDAVILKFWNQLVERDEEIARIQEKLANMEIKKLEIEWALKKEKST
ncbi:hypothetical protein OPQ81_003393 [Rhizoctonia solani]|nr:hypothetical protein OPQ81_011810 [Rhizoctonia solani]KAJ1300968.1 hypothetical protein OPQ81_003393 [Rhizoctonia solani]